jgi:hypothetical protein
MLICSINRQVAGAIPHAVVLAALHLACVDAVVAARLPAI